MVIKSIDSKKITRVVFWKRCLERPGWATVLFLSILYFVCLMLVNSGILKPGLLFGFCVSGYPHTPDTNEGCHKSPINSHIISFVIDFVVTCMVGVFWYLDQNQPRDTAMYAVMGFIILSHGTLHWFLQQNVLSVVIDCYSKVIEDDIDKIGYALFGSFSFALSLAILGYGFGLNNTTVMGSVGFAAIIIHASKQTHGELFLPVIFCVAHLLGSFTGLYSNEPCFSSTVARWFIISTIIGIVEISACDNILKPIGGHFWYDLALHSAVLASLPYFWSPANAKVLPRETIPLLGAALKKRNEIYWRKYP